MRSVRMLALLVLAFASGLPDLAAAQSKFFTFEQNFDRLGNDFSNSASDSAVDCSFTCGRNNAVHGPSSGPEFRGRRGVVS